MALVQPPADEPGNLDDFFRVNELLKYGIKPNAYFGDDRFIEHAKLKVLMKNARTSCKRLITVTWYNQKNTKSNKQANKVTSKHRGQTWVMSRDNYDELVEAYKECVALKRILACEIDFYTSNQGHSNLVIITDSTFEHYEPHGDKYGSSTGKTASNAVLQGTFSAIKSVNPAIQLISSAASCPRLPANWDESIDDKMVRMRKVGELLHVAFSDDTDLMTKLMHKVWPKNNAKHQRNRDIALNQNSLQQRIEYVDTYFAEYTGNMCYKEGLGLQGCESYARMLSTETALLPGFARLSGQSASAGYVKDPGGFCAMWSLLYLDFRLANPTKTAKDLRSELFSLMKTESAPRFLRKYIRGYAYNAMSDMSKALGAQEMWQYYKHQNSEKIHDTKVRKWLIKENGKLRKTLTTMHNQDFKSTYAKEAAAEPLWADSYPSIDHFNVDDVSTTTLKNLLLQAREKASKAKLKPPDPPPSPPKSSPDSPDTGMAAPAGPRRVPLQYQSDTESDFDEEMIVSRKNKKGRKVQIEDDDDDDDDYEHYNHFTPHGPTPSQIAEMQNYNPSDNTFGMVHNDSDQGSDSNDVILVPSPKGTADDPYVL